MGFFTGLGIFVACLFTCTIIFITIFVIYSLNHNEYVDDEDMQYIIIFYSIVLTLLISSLITIFVTNPKNFGYEKINKNETVIEVESENGELVNE
jgi:hypothetical protein